MACGDTPFLETCLDDDSDDEALFLGDEDEDWSPYKDGVAPGDLTAAAAALAPALSHLRDEEDYEPAAGDSPHSEFDTCQFAMRLGGLSLNSSPLPEASYYYGNLAQGYPQPSTFSWHGTSNMGLISDASADSGGCRKPDLLSNIKDPTTSPAELIAHGSAESCAEVPKLARAPGSNMDQLSLSLFSMSCHPPSCGLLRQSNPYPFITPLLYGPECSEPCTADSCCPSPHAHLPSLSVRQRAASILWNLVTAGEADEQEVVVFKHLESVRAYCDLVRCLLCKCGLLMPAVGGAEVSAQCSHALACLLELSYSESARRYIAQLGGVEGLSDLLLVDVCQTRGRPSVHSLFLRRYAASALTNLSFGDASCKRRLCLRSHAMWALVEQLRSSEEEELCQVTAAVLRNLSWQADAESRAVLGRLDAAGVLTRCALAARREPTLRSLLSALWNLSAHSTANKESVCAVPGALRLLCACLTAPAALAETGGGVLRNVSSVVAVREDLRAAVRPAYPLLLHQLRAASLTVVANACGTLWNISTSHVGDQRLLTELGAVPMLRCLVLSKHKVIRLASASALRNLLAAKPLYSPSPPLQAQPPPASSPQRSASNESLRSAISDLTHDRAPPLSPLSTSVHYNSAGRSELTLPQCVQLSQDKTPMVFSRGSSSGHSLDSFDIRSLHSSLSSEYSHGISAALSPSCLPDTPGEIVAACGKKSSTKSSPSHASSSTSSKLSGDEDLDSEILQECIRSGMPVTQKQDIPGDKPRVFRVEHTPSPPSPSLSLHLSEPDDGPVSHCLESAVIYKTEDTPGQFSRRSSAGMSSCSSSLSVDSDTADILLEACISSALPKQNGVSASSNFPDEKEDPRSGSSAPFFWVGFGGCPAHKGVGPPKPKRQPTPSLRHRQRRQDHNSGGIPNEHSLYPLAEETLSSCSSMIEMDGELTESLSPLEVSRKLAVDNRTFSIHSDDSQLTLEFSDMSDLSASSIEIDAAAIRESPLPSEVKDTSQDTDNDLTDSEDECEDFSFSSRDDATFSLPSTSTSPANLAPVVDDIIPPVLVLKKPSASIMPPPKPVRTSSIKPPITRTSHLPAQVQQEETKAPFAAVTTKPVLVDPKNTFIPISHSPTPTSKTSSGLVSPLNLPLTTNSKIKKPATLVSATSSGIPTPSVTPTPKQSLEKDRPVVVTKLAQRFTATVTPRRSSIPTLKTVKSNSSSPISRSIQNSPTGRASPLIKSNQKPKTPSRVQSQSPSCIKSTGKPPQSPKDAKSESPISCLKQPVKCESPTPRPSQSPLAASTPRKPLSDHFGVSSPRSKTIPVGVARPLGIVAPSTGVQPSQMRVSRADTTSSTDSGLGASFNSTSGATDSPVLFRETPSQASITSDFTESGPVVQQRSWGQQSVMTTKDPRSNLTVQLHAPNHRLSPDTSQPITFNLTINNNSSAPFPSPPILQDDSQSKAGVGRARIVKKSKVEETPPAKKVIVGGGKVGSSDKRLRTISGAPVKKPLSLQKPPSTVKMNRSAAARLGSASKISAVKSDSQKTVFSPKPKLKQLTESLSNSVSSSSDDGTVWITKEEVCALLPRSCKS